MAPLSSMVIPSAALTLPAARLHSLHSAPPHAKIIHLIRHAEGTHNVEKDYKSPLHLDAALTQLGVQQCRDFSLLNNNLQVECIITSPMTRAIQTAQYCFENTLTKSSTTTSSNPRSTSSTEQPPSTTDGGVVPFIASEEWRETVNYLCDVRRNTSILRDEFPYVNFNLLEHDTDPLWGYYEERFGSQLEFDKHRESDDLDSLQRRARAAWNVVAARKERVIGIVSHSAFFMHMFNSFGHQVVTYEDDEVEQLLSGRFENCEMRSIAFETP